MNAATLQAGPFHRALRGLAAAILLVALAACGAREVWAPDADLVRAAHVTGAAPSVTLFTVISTASGSGGHSALMIDGRERVLFDPAGSWYHPHVPERNDVHYGITERIRIFYIDYHARPAYYVREQRVPVSLEVAETIRRRAEAYGAVSQVFCTWAVSALLEGLPGFETIGRTMFPLRLSAGFAALPGVISQEHFDGDPAIVSDVVMIEPARRLSGD